MDNNINEEYQAEVVGQQPLPKKEKISGNVIVGLLSFASIFIFLLSVFFASLTVTATWLYCTLSVFNVIALAGAGVLLLLDFLKTKKISITPIFAFWLIAILISII